MLSLSLTHTLTLPPYPHNPHSIHIALRCSQLQDGAAVSALDKETGCAPLHIAAAHGKLDALELLLQAGKRNRIQYYLAS